MHPGRPAPQSPNRRSDVLSADHQTNDARLSNAPGAFQDLHDQSAQIVELREQLFDEFHHRLKNSLQMLYGLLQIAWSKTDSTEAREALSDTSRRIGAMGTAQQIFYSVHNSTDVSGQRLLEAVCTNARAFFSNKVSINCEAAGGALPQEPAMPLALAFNELLTNATKNGANARGHVTINVGLSQRAGEIELYVHDHGPGFDFEEVRGRSAGLGLVTVLAARRRATVT